MRGKCFFLVFVVVMSAFLLASSSWGQEGKDVESLILALKNKDSIVREEAARTLGRIGDPRAVEPLIAALRDEDACVREKADWALQRITGQDLGEDYEAWIHWWEENKEKFGQ